jgi:hypothetical protein
MSKSRMLVVAAFTALAAMLIGGAGSAAAQTSGTPLTKSLAMTGKAKNGKKFTGTYTIDRFVRKGNKQYAVGTLKGRLTGRRVSRENVRIPVALARHQAAGASQLPGQPPNPLPNACQILDLELQPITLNLLGLLVRTSRIEVLIEAVPGAGNLLGNLLCGITGILDPQAATPASPSVLTQVLNALLALVPRTA